MNRMFKSICCIFVLVFYSHVFASQNDGKDQLIDKSTIIEQHATDKNLKSNNDKIISNSTKAELQVEKQSDQKLEVQNPTDIKNERELIKKSSPESEVAVISPNNNTLKIKVTTDKKSHSNKSYEAAIAIGIPLIILFVTNIVTLYKIRAESKAAIQNELSMSTIRLKKDQLSLFYDPIIALLDTNSEIFNAFSPQTFPEDPHLGDEALHIWNILVDKVILPNNSELVTIIKRNTHLMSPDDNFEIYLRYMKHAVSYEAFRDTPNELHGNFRFPNKFLPNVKKFRDKVLNELRVLERKLK